MTYVITEPDIQKVFVDVKGKFHVDHDKALASNFKHDLQNWMQDIVANSPNGSTMADYVTTLAKRNPDMLRILVGDRDYT